MNLEIEQGFYENLTEIYIIGENAVEVVTQNDKRFKVFAKETLREPHNFSASYEELVKVKFDSQSKIDGYLSIWTRNYDMPWEQGKTIE